MADTIEKDATDLAKEETTDKLLVSEYQKGDKKWGFTFNKDIISSICERIQREPEKFYVTRDGVEWEFPINKLLTELPRGGECAIKFAAGGDSDDDITDAPPKKAKTSHHRVTKDHVLQALNLFRSSDKCQYNSFCPDVKLKDGEVSKSLERFAIIGEQLPVTGRDKELSQLQECISTNIEIWHEWKKQSAELDGTAKSTSELAKRTYQHPAVADGPGRGKTTLMTRGADGILHEKFKESYTGRCFLWDLHESPLTETEKRLFIDALGDIDNFAGAQTVLALRILHQSINGNTGYTDFLVNLEICLEKQDLTLADVTLEVVLEHILSGGVPLSGVGPHIVLLHISETNELLERTPYTRLELLMKAAYQFNKQQGVNAGKYFLAASFDGTHRAELLCAFKGSGIQSCLIELQASSIRVYIEILAAIAALGKAQRIRNASSLERIVYSARFKAVLSDCGDNLRIFSLLVYVIGCYGSANNSFSWARFFENLGLYHSEVYHVNRWASSVINKVTEYFSKYTELLLRLGAKQLLRVIAPALLNLSVADDLSSKILDSPYSWEDLEKDGAISLHNTHVELPFMLVSIYLNTLLERGTSFLAFLAHLKDLQDESRPRQNEKCDMSLIILALFNYHFNHPSTESFRLKDILPVSGTASNIKLKFPSVINQVDLLKSWPPILSHIFNENTDLAPGAYIGPGNDAFADSWVVFERLDGNGVVVLAVESKRRINHEILTADYFNTHKRKVQDELSGTKFVFVMVADMSAHSIEADKDELIVTKENMEILYGRWLAQRREFALSRP